MKRKNLVVFALMLALVFVFTSCAPNAGKPADQKGTETKPAANSDEILIGSILDLSGAMAVAGKQTKWGSEYAVNQINAKGGINGKKLKIVTYDCKSDSNEGINAYNRLVQEGAVAIVGPGLSNIGIPIASVAEEKKVAFVGQFMDERATTNEKTGKAWNYMFLAEPSCGQQAEIMAGYSVDKLGIKTVGVLYDSSNSYAVTHAEPFKKYVESKGVQVVAYESFGKDAKDYKAQLLKIIAKKPDAIFIPNYVQTNALAYKQARELGYKGTIIGNNTYTPPFADLVGGAKIDENLVFLFNIDMQGKDTKFLTDDYLKQFNGEQPAFNIAFGYDDVMIIANALSKVKDVKDTVAVAKAIETETKDVQTASGKITLDPATHRPVGMGAFIAVYDSNKKIKLLEYYLPKK